MMKKNDEKQNSEELDRIVLVSALDLEQQGFHDNMTGVEEIKTPIQGLTLYEGDWNGITINTLTTNMGETNVVSRFQSVLDYIHNQNGNLENTAAIFYGVGGGLIEPCAGIDLNNLPGYFSLPASKIDWGKEDLSADKFPQDPNFVKQGDIVIIRNSIDGDESVSALPTMSHLQTGELPLGVDPNDTKRIWSSNDSLSDYLVQSAQQAGLKVKDDGYSQQSKRFINLGYMKVGVEPNHIYQARIGSVDDPQKEKHIAEAKHFFEVTRNNCNYDGRLPNVVNMEDTSFLKTASNYGVPAAIVRVISDHYGSHPNDFMEFITKKNKDSAKHLEEMFKIVGEKYSK